MEERERFHAAGNCCVIRAFTDSKIPERLCSNARQPDGCKCEHHAAMER